MMLDEHYDEKGRDLRFMPGSIEARPQTLSPVGPPDGSIVTSVEVEDFCPNCRGPAVWRSSAARGIYDIDCYQGCNPKE